MKSTLLVQHVITGHGTSDVDRCCCHKSFAIRHWQIATEQFRAAARTLDILTEAKDGMLTGMAIPPFACLPVKLAMFDAQKLLCAHRRHP